MSYTLKLLGKFLRNLMMLGLILAGLWATHWSFAPLKSGQPVSGWQFLGLMTIWTIDVIALACFVMFLDERGYIHNWWTSINQFFIKRVDPITIAVCDFFNRRNGGCKEE